jgi:hypothetical protein
MAAADGHDGRAVIRTRKRLELVARAYFCVLFCLVPPIPR